MDDADMQPSSLIAIMLGRLEMDVDECIAAYIRLNEEIFRKRLVEYLSVSLVG